MSAVKPRRHRPAGTRPPRRAPAAKKTRLKQQRKNRGKRRDHATWSAPVIGRDCPRPEPARRSASGHRFEDGRQDASPQGARRPLPRERCARMKGTASKPTTPPIRMGKRNAQRHRREGISDGSRRAETCKGSVRSTHSAAWQGRGGPNPVSERATGHPPA